MRLQCQRRRPYSADGPRAAPDLGPVARSQIPIEAEGRSSPYPTCFRLAGHHADGKLSVRSAIRTLAEADYQSMSWAIERWGEKQARRPWRPAPHHAVQGSAG